jgi:hypothetical protein
VSIVYSIVCVKWLLGYFAYVLYKVWHYFLHAILHYKLSTNPYTTTPYTLHTTYTTTHSPQPVTHFTLQADSKHAQGVGESDATLNESSAPHLTTPDRKHTRKSSHTHNTAALPATRDPPAFVVRVYETHGSRGRAVLRISSRILHAIGSCVRVNILEEQVCVDLWIRVCMCVYICVCSCVNVMVLIQAALHSMLYWTTTPSHLTTLHYSPVKCHSATLQTKQWHCRRAIPRDSGAFQTIPSAFGAGDS